MNRNDPWYGESSYNVYRGSSYRETYHEPREIKVVIDSGASVAALPKSLARDYPMKKVIPKNYRTASGEPVRSLGEREPIVNLENGAMAKMKFTVMDVHRPLAAVSKMVDAGHRIVFDSEENGGSFVEDRYNNCRHRLYLENGVYVLPIKIREAKTKRPFQWQG